MVRSRLLSSVRCCPSGPTLSLLRVARVFGVAVGTQLWSSQVFPTAVSVFGGIQSCLFGFDGRERNGTHSCSRLSVATGAADPTYLFLLALVPSACVCHLSSFRLRSQSSAPRSLP